MNTVTSIALSGLQAAQADLHTHAHNIANGATPGFQRRQAVHAEAGGGGVSTRVDTRSAEGPALADDLVGLLGAKHAFAANLAVFRTADQMLGALLDARA